MKINNFTGMGTDGLYYLEGMTQDKISGKSILTPNWYARNYISEDTTLFSDFDGANGMDKTNYGLTSSSDLYGQLVSIGTGDIFSSSDLVSARNIGKIHTVAGTGSGTDQILASNDPDVSISLNNNIVYSTAHHLGVGFIGTVKTGSGTTSIIDDAGRDLTTLGVSTSAGSNKVYNLNNKEEYTITSITTTNSTNDTLNFSAGTANAEDDIFIAFVDDRFKFTVSASYGEQFGDQVLPSNWSRQIKIWDDYMWILNGNYVSRLAIDDTTWTSDILVENHKQLPYLTQAVCMEKNQDRLLIGGSYKGRGKLVLTDGWSDGWLSIIELSKAPSSIVEYSSGWIVLVDKTLYFTNGYTLQKLDEFQEERPETSAWSVSKNGMVNVSNRIMVNVKDTLSKTSSKSGVYVYDTEKRWSYIPMAVNTTSTVYALELDTAEAIFYDGSYVYASGGNTSTTNTNFLNKIVSGGGSKEKSLVVYVDLGEKQKISGIKLKLSPKIDEFGTTGNVAVTVNVGDGKIPFWQYTQVDAGGSSSQIINGLASSGYYGQIGQEIRCLEGATAGERSYITAITNPGESSEAWTISPALTATPTTNSNINMLGVKKTETQTFSGDDIPDDLPFFVDGFFSDKLFIEVVIKPAGSQEIDLYEIEIIE